MTKNSNNYLDKYLVAYHSNGHLMYEILSKKECPLIYDTLIYNPLPKKVKSTPLYKALHKRVKHLKEYKDRCSLLYIVRLDAWALSQKRYQEQIKKAKKFK